MNQAGAQQRSFEAAATGVITRALQACDLRHSDWRDVVQDIPETKGATRKAGGDPEVIFEEVKALFPGRPAELLDYYQTGRPPSW